MAVVKTVTSGQPIKAGWANSLVNEVNTKQGLKLGGRSASSTSLRPIRIDNEPAFQISKRNGVYSINAGQIYINGILIESETNSFNQLSSMSDWKENSFHSPNDENDIPVWWLKVVYPSQLTEENKGEVVCNLIKTKSGEENEPEQPEVNDNQKSKLIQLNTVVNGQVKQLVSGSIYINDTLSNIDIKGDNGIEVTKTNDTYNVKLYISIITKDGIEISDELWREKPENKDVTPTRVFTVGLTPISFIDIDRIILRDEFANIPDDQNPEQTKRVRVIEVANPPCDRYEFDGNVIVKTEQHADYRGYTYNKHTISVTTGDTPTVEIKEGDNVEVRKTNNTFTIHADGISLIAGDGISIEHDEDDLTHITAYTIKATNSYITPDFDPEWFNVVDGKVTLNQTALNTVIDEAVNEIGVNINVNGLLEYTDHSTGRLNAISETNLTLDTNVTY